MVIENNHIVILGFIEGEYLLIKELIKGAGDNKLCIVIGCDRDKSEVESLIKDNVVCPKNVKIVCRTIKSITPTSLDCLSIETCKNIIINPTDDESVIKYVYVLTHMLKEINRSDVVIVATIRSREFLLPEEFSNGMNVIFLILSDFVARIIARSCTQPGLSLAYLELFNNKGSELYSVSDSKLIGHSFMDVMLKLNNGVPVGIINNNETIINPNKDYIIKNDDKLVVFSENKDSSYYVDGNNHNINADKVCTVNKVKKQNSKILILGYNESFDILLNELDTNDSTVVFAGITDDNYNLVKNKIRRKKHYKLLDPKYSIDETDDLVKLTKDIDRVILLNNYAKNGDSADIKIMLRLTKLREICKKYNRNYTVLVELRRAANRTLIHEDDYTDYIVRTSMFSMFLSQLSSNPELKPIYDELLSYKGNCISLLPCSIFDLNNTYTYEIRRQLYLNGYIYLGIIKQGTNNYQCVFNPDLNDKIELGEYDNFVVIRK